MDVLAACRAFVSVSSHGSFTAGASAARIPQSVASRRVAALETHLGGRLFDRTSRTVLLTPFGRQVLASARRLLDAADAFEDDAVRARSLPVRLAVPEAGALETARFVAAARAAGVDVQPVAAPPGRRADLVRTHEVELALVAVPAPDARWRVPLGLAGRRPPGSGRLAALRRGRSRGAGPLRRVWLLPEDDVPHVRDPVIRARDAAGLRPGQLVVGAGFVEALATVLTGDDLLLCPQSHAASTGLGWTALQVPTVLRGYAPAVPRAGVVDVLDVLDVLDAAVADLLGAR